MAIVTGPKRRQVRDWPDPVAPSTFVPIVERAGALVTITLKGRLDAHAGVELLAALQDEIDTGTARVDVDLQAIEDWTPEGARALRRARRLARVLDDGLHYRCAPGAGHEALLEAFDDEAVDLDEIDGDEAATA
jgi:hypothetical protein